MGCPEYRAPHFFILSYPYRNVMMTKSRLCHIVILSKVLSWQDDKIIFSSRQLYRRMTRRQNRIEDCSVFTTVAQIVITKLPKRNDDKDKVNLVISSFCQQWCHWWSDKTWYCRLVKLYRTLRKWQNGTPVIEKSLVETSAYRSFRSCFYIERRRGSKQVAGKEF